MIFKSNFPKLDIPNIDIPQFCIREGKRRSSQSSKRCGFAIRDGPTGKSMDIYQLETASIKLASGFAHKLNIQPNQVVSIFSPNTIYYPVVVYGTLMLGGIVTLTNPTYTPREFAHQLKDSNSVAIATQSHLLKVTLEAIRLSGLNIPMQNIFLLDIHPVNNSPYSHIEDLYLDKPVKICRIGTEEEASKKVAVIQYSSGTTGLAKGVLLTHKNILSSMIMNSCFAVYDEWFDRSKYPPKFIGVLPFYHSYGFGSVLNLGISMVFCLSLFLSLIELKLLNFSIRLSSCA
ncbi:hypothetical protein BB560_003682 [Smittium megazygosporum]|uniref:AMP-dependent synthetase/ligase domain-containing protein n=1 Tax=Smittium megazygosporum TaxID=133381 RepID=A0A2T9ZBC7_9FUNG|nr:hypothetical protein BB560_003682 [Smittium megazygosporum]